MTKNFIGRLLVIGILLAALIGLLAAYLAVVSTLPKQIYTSAQQDYLKYNNGRSVAQQAPVLNIIQAGGQIAPANLPGQNSRVRATLAARYAEQDGVSVTIYDLDFRGEYELAHAAPETTTVELFFPFPGNLETLHEVTFLVDNREPPGVIYTTAGINWQTTLKPNEKHQLVVSYKADGANSFTYSLPRNQRANVDIEVTVTGAQGSHAPRVSLPPTANNANNDGDGEIFTWHYNGLIADRDIQLTLPVRLSFSQRLAQLQDDFLALAMLSPVLVGLFLAALFGACRLAEVRLSLESYLLTGCSVALFYPLLTFLSGMIDLSAAAVAALLIVAGLVLFFLSLSAGWQKIWWRVGLLLFIFLGLFSLGLLTPWRGLLLTFGGLLLVGLLMVLYALRPVPPPAPKVETLPASKPKPATPPPPVQAAPHCPYCGLALAANQHFCPGCGHDVTLLRRCACGHEQLVLAEAKTAYCINCGQLLKR